MMTSWAQLRRPLFEPGWVARHLDDIAHRGLQHLQLTVIAVVLGLTASMLIALAVLRWRRLYPPVLAVTGLLYAVPSLALFALLVPVTGLTVTTAEAALVGYTLLILIRNIVSGVDSVPADVKEAAVAMGLGRGRLLWEVELPLALPVIMAGLRIATVTVIGLVTVTALIGLGGFGALILDGIRRGIVFPTPVVVGTALSVAMAVVLDLVLLGVQRMLTPWTARV